MWWWACLACVEPEPQVDGWEWPEPEQLSALPEPPDPLRTYWDDQAVADVAMWEGQRRAELMAMFQHYAYGYSAPPLAVAATVQVLGTTLDGRAELVTVAAAIGGLGTAEILLVRPVGVARPPVVVGLEKCGNHTVIADDRVPVPTGFAGPTCETARGARAAYWDLDQAISAGLAVATVFQADFAPDDRDRLDEGLAAAAGGAAGDAQSEWGAIGRWAWGLRHVVDALLAAELVDAERVMVMGHSRRGKAALWASAQDDRFAMVWAHQSGTLGAALSRVPAGGQAEGESVAAITTFFPHWFAPRLLRFAEREVHMPFDQHLLLALSAPRPVLLIDGEADRWADPDGATAALALAEPVWALYGEAGSNGRRLRPGDHEVNATDWSIFIEEARERGLLAELGGAE